MWNQTIFCAISIGWALAVLSTQCRYPKLSYSESRGGRERLAVWIERAKFRVLAHLSLPSQCLCGCPLAGCVDGQLQGVSPQLPAAVGVTAMERSVSGGPRWLSSSPDRVAATALPAGRVSWPLLAQRLGESYPARGKLPMTRLTKRKCGWMLAELGPVSFSCFDFLADGTKEAGWGSSGNEAKDSEWALFPTRRPVQLFILKLLHKLLQIPKWRISKEMDI